MAYGDKTQPTRIEQWLEARSPDYRYGWVLLFLAATFIVMSAEPPDAWVRVITVVLQSLTLLAALLASRTGRRLFRAASVVVVLAFLSSLISVIVSSSNEPSGAFFLLNVLLVGTAPAVIARALWRRGVVDVHTVLGAVCIYVLLGMTFSFIYAAIGHIGSAPFFVQTRHATIPNYLYFSFVTQTTVGYGDFTAAGDLGRALAALEALIGQLYLVTIIAVLVSRMTSTRRPIPTDTTDVADVDPQP